MNANFFLFIIVLWGYIMYNYHPIYTCQRECKELSYPDLCYSSCENEHDQRRYTNEAIGHKKHNISDYKPSDHWYGLTNSHRYSKNEISGYYLGLAGTGYSVKYLKVKQQYVNDMYKELDNSMIEKYIWYIPAMVPILFPVNIKKENQKSLNFLHKSFGVKVVINVKREILNFGLEEVNIHISSRHCENYYVHTQYTSQKKVHFVKIPLFGVLRI